MYKIGFKEYRIKNIIEFIVNESKVLYNKYGHCKEFMKLNNKIRNEAHRVISTKALILENKSEFFGIEDNVNGNVYEFEIFSDCNYRVVDVTKYKENIREVVDESYIN